MAIETPGHRERFYLTNDIHLVDSSVARYATYAAIHVGAVVKVNVVWKIVDSCPFHSFTGRLTLSNRQQLVAVVRIGRCRASAARVHVRSVEFADQTGQPDRI